MKFWQSPVHYVENGRFGQFVNPCTRERTFYVEDRPITLTETLMGEEPCMTCGKTVEFWAASPYSPTGECECGAKLIMSSTGKMFSME